MKETTLNALDKSKKIYTPFGVDVKKTLIDRGLTMTQLEQMIGAPDNYLTMVLRGKRPGRKYVPLIATILEMDLTKYAV